MRRAPPLVHAACAFIAGLLGGFRLPSGPHPLILTLAAGAAGVLLLLLRRGRYAPLIALVVIGLAVGHGAALRAGSDCRFGIPDGARVRVRGAFEAWPAPDRPTRFRLEHVRVRGRSFACVGTVRARPSAAVDDVPPPGAEVVGRGRWWAQPAEGGWPHAGERAGTLLLDSLELLAPGAVGHHPLLSMRGAVQLRLRRLVGERSALAEALLLAERDGLDAAVRDRFVRAGIVHVLAISGLHVGLITATLLLVGRLLRLAPRSAALLAIGATGAYVAFLGVPHAAGRAALQISLLLAARLAQRPSDPLALMAAAALALLAVDPLAVLSPGFQLSFAGAGGIILLRRPLITRLPDLGPHLMRDGLATGLAATLATAPIAALHFGRFAPVGVLATLAAVPLVGAAVPTLALALAAGIVAPPVGELLAGAGGLLLAALEGVAAAAAALPWGHAYVPRDQVVGWAAAALLGLALRRRLSGMRPRVRRTLAAAGAAAVLVGWPIAARHAHHRGGFEIHAIDVGQGDAIAIRSPAGRWMLVDAGPRSDRWDAGRARVVPFLLKRSVRRLDALILTHAHLDHIGGAAAVLDAFDVAAIIEPGVPVGSAAYRELLERARARGIRWIAARPGREIAWDGAIVRFLAPDRDMVDDADAANNVSVVFRVAYGRFAALFLGDAPAGLERTLVRRHGRGLRSDVLKVAHHGSATSTAPALLAATTPAIALIPVGRHNRYGHPHPLVLRRLERGGIRVLRTDRDGAITVRARSDGRMRVETRR